MKNFVYKKGSDRIEPSQPSFIIPASSLSMPTHFHKMPIQVGQPVEGERMLFWACTYRNITEKKHGSSKHVKKWTNHSCQ